MNRCTVPRSRLTMRVYQLANPKTIIISIIILTIMSTIITTIVISDVVWYARSPSYLVTTLRESSFFLRLWRGWRKCMIIALTLVIIAGVRAYYTVNTSVLYYAYVLQRQSVSSRLCRACRVRVRWTSVRAILIVGTRSRVLRTTCILRINISFFFPFFAPGM